MPIRHKYQYEQNRVLVIWCAYSLWCMHQRLQSNYCVVFSVNMVIV